METSGLNKNAGLTMLKLGTCSRTSLHVLNDGFGQSLPAEERAAEPLAGGIMLQGQQCGLLWGATLAAGAEAYRRFPDRDRAIGAAIAAAQELVTSFSNHTGTVNCRAITGTDFSKRAEMARYIVFRAWRCFRLASQWAPKAFSVVQRSLSKPDAAESCKSCASEVVKQLGGSEQEQVMVAGFAGGIGLSGAACGALSAAIWKKMLEASRSGESKQVELMENPEAKRILDSFLEAHGSRISCHELCGRRFATPAEHSAFVEAGGCRSVIEQLVASSAS